MDAKTTGIVGYITWIGFLIAYFAGDKEGAKFHLNQALVLAIASIGLSLIAAIFGAIPFFGWIVSLAAGVCDIIVLVLMIMGIVNAANGEEKPLPIIGGIKILK